MLTAQQILNLQTPARSGTLRFRSQQPTPAPTEPIIYTLTVQNDLNINDNDTTTPQPSFTIGPFALQIGNGGTTGGISGNLRVDDGGLLIFNRSVDTLYTGTLSVEDEDNALLNNVEGTTVTFDGTAGTNGLAIRASQSGTVAAPGTPSTYELEIGGDGDGVISGIIADGGAARPGSFEKTGDGAWTFSGTNTYNGTTTVSEGTLNIANSAGLGTTAGGTIVEDGATLSLEGGIAIGAEALTIEGEGALGDDQGEGPAGALHNEIGNNSFAGNITLSGDALILSDEGTLTLSGTVGGPFALELGGDGDGVITGRIQSNVAGVTKEGDGAWTLSGDNAYAGATTVEEGTLNITSATGLGTTDGGTIVEDGATLSLEGGIAVGAEALTIAGRGDLGDDPGEGETGALLNEIGDNSFAGDITLSGDALIQSDEDTLTLSGTIGGPFALALGGDGDGVITGRIQSNVASVTKEGDGAWTLSGNNAYAGTTTVEDGTLNITSATGLGTTDGGTVVENGATLSLEGGITVGAEALTIAGRGDLGDDPGEGRTGALHNEIGDNSFAGDITLSGDALILSDEGTLALSGMVGGAFALAVGGDGDGVISGRIQSNITSVTKEGGGAWTFSGDNAYAGTTTVEDGTLNVSSATGLGTTAGGTVVETGATLSLEGGIAVGAEALTIAGRGDLGDDPGEGRTGALHNEIGDNSFAGAITLSDDALILSDEGTLVLSGTIGGPFALTVGGDGDGVVSGRIQSNVTSVTKEGDGTWTFSGNNAYAGGTNLDDGTLELGMLSSAGTGAITFGDDEQTLQIDVAGTLGNEIDDFGVGDFIDLRAITFAGAKFTMNGDALTVTESAGNGADSNTLDIGPALSGYKYVLGSDGSGGTTVSLIEAVPPGQPDSPTLTAASDTGASQNDGITNVQRPTFTGMAEAGSTITLYEGNTVLGTAMTGSDGTYTVTAKKLGQGDHTVSVTATDAAGNVSQASDPTTISIDITPPGKLGAPTLDNASDTGSSPNDGITSETQPVLTGTATAGATVTLFDDSQRNADGSRVALATTTAGSDGSYSITSPTLSDGRHILRVTQMDTAGNSSAISNGRRVTVDTVDPDVSITSSGGMVSQSRQTITGMGEYGTKITLTDNGANVATVSVRADGTWSRTLRLTPGDHDIVATDTDRAGNTGTSQTVSYDYAPPGANARTASAAAQPQAASSDPDFTSALFNAAFAPGYTESYAAPGPADPNAAILAASHDLGARAAA